MSASITKQVNKRMEKVAETGTNFLCAGIVLTINRHHSTHGVLISFFSGKEVVSDVSATLTSSKDKMTGALSRLGKHYEQTQISLFVFT